MCPDSNDLRTQARELAGLIGRAKTLTVFTGAGISTSAGIPDFRGENGMYTQGKFTPEVFDIDTFTRDPHIFYTYAREFAKQEETIRPTFTHSFLARLEQEGRLAWIITQNIDGLHRKAGNKNIIELHGDYHRSYCLTCGVELAFGRWKDKMNREDVPHCDTCGGVIKPDIVFFKEAVKSFGKAEEIVSKCDLLLVIGSSLTVYPAALLPRLVKGQVIVINKGDVNLAGVNIKNIDADIDEFFKMVAAEREPR